MALEEVLYTRLTTATGVSSLVSTRVRPMRLKQNETLPAITFQRISRTSIHKMGADAALAPKRVQVRSWADTYSGAKALSDEVRLALSRWSTATGMHHAFLLNEIDLTEEDKGEDEVLFSVLQDFRFWHED